MKLINLSFIFALVLSVSVVGCGKSSDQPNNSDPGVVTNGVSSAPGVVTPIAGANGTLPIGCYTNGSQTCAACPIGFQQSGSSCITMSGGYNNGGTGYNNPCGANMFYNGYNCQQVGYQYSSCPYGTTWSNYYYACVGTTSTYGSWGSRCQQKSYAGGLLYTYVCY